MRPDLSAYPLVMTTAQAAELLGTTPTYLRHLTRTGQVPAHRMGRLVRIYREELATWLADLPTGEVPRGKDGA